MRLINAEIHHGWLSPDKTLLFGLSWSGERLVAALYTLDGTMQTAPIPLAAPTDKVPDLPQLKNVWEVPGMEFIWWAWSPDGKKIACRDTAGALWVINVEKGASQLARNLRGDGSLSFSNNWLHANTNDLFWSPEGDYLIAQSGKRVWVVDIEE